VMLHDPGIVIAEFVGQFDLGQGILQQIIFAVVLPGPG
jgi:hypothetical protein